MSTLPLHTSLTSAAESTKPIGPGVEGIISQIGEKFIEVETQLSKAQVALKQSVALRDRLKEELCKVQEREDQWRKKVQEFDMANRAWAAQYQELSQAAAALDLDSEQSKIS